MAAVAHRAWLLRLLAVGAPGVAIAVLIAITPATGTSAPSSSDATGEVSDAKAKPPLFDVGKWFDVRSLDAPSSWKPDAKSDVKFDTGTDANQL